MLILSRRVGEKIVIGDNIHVTVLAIRGNQIRLGFSAPPSVSIYREEISASAQENKQHQLCGLSSANT
jgi:carbon storage regulator